MAYTVDMDEEFCARTRALFGAHELSHVAAFDQEREALPFLAGLVQLEHERGNHENVESEGEAQQRGTTSTSAWHARRRI